MGTAYVFDVKADFGAAGDGQTIDDGKIQDAINAAAAAGGGTVYFPNGKYLISKTLLLPSKVLLLGAGGTTFGTRQYDISDADPMVFLELCASIICLDDGANVNMLEDLQDPNEKYLNNSGIENLIFYGNKENQDTGNGIVLNDLPITGTVQEYERGHNRFRNVLIYHVKETGFIGGKGHHELHIDNVICYGCDGHGVVLYGQDIKANRLQSGGNGGTGLVITGGGAGRYNDIDVWGNQIGIEIFDTMNLFFFGLSSSLNVECGLYIHDGNDANSYPPVQIQIFRGIFDTNSTFGYNSFPDISITSNASNGPSNIELIGCLFRGTTNAEKPSRAIEDASTYPARNNVTNCFFQTENYASGIINDTAIYSFHTNYDYTSRRCLDEANLPYAQAIFPTPTPNTYELSPTECFVTVDCYGGNKVVTLPLLSKTQAGKYFIISVSNIGNQLEVTVQPQSSDTIEGDTTLTEQHQTLMIINAQAHWYSIRIR